MSFNGSGQFLLNSGGLPYVTGTTISSTHANNLNTDLATGLTTCITKDGQTTVTANLPMATFRHTNVGAASARTDYARASQVQDSTLIAVGTIAGTNTITGSLSPAITAYAAGQFYTFIPANTNTGATTININSVGARNVFWNGAACVGGEIRQNIPCVIYDDGTRFHIVGNGFNAPFLDTHPIVEGSADSTKKVRLEVDGLTTATTRVLTVPDSDGTLITTGNAAAQGSSMVLLSSKTASNSASLAFSTGDFSWTDYDEYVFKFYNLRPATDAQGLLARFSTDGGSNYLSDANYNWSYMGFTTANAANSAGATGATGVLVLNSVGNSASFLGLRGTLHVWTPSATMNHSCSGTFHYFDSAAVEVKTSMGTYVGSTTAINGIQFLFQAGNITSGSIRVYGVRTA